MNGAAKFHKPKSPAFNVGEQWESHAGKIRCKIVSVAPYPKCTGKWDYEVTYEYEDGTRHSKDAWNFQVRYHHIADRSL